MKKLTFIAVLVMVISICFTVSAFAEFYVISVQNQCGPCKGTSSSGGRWCDNGDGTVTDMTTCLVWLKYADWGGMREWEGPSRDDYAHIRAGFLASGETISPSGETPVFLTDGSAIGDWRLPTKTELVGITIGDEYVRSGFPRLFEGVKSSNYWSSTPDSVNGSSAWHVNMSNGSVGSGEEAGEYYVWPVRSDN